MDTERSEPMMAGKFFVLVFFGLLLTFSAPIHAAAATLCVRPGGGGGCFATVSDAVNHAHAGDTINVAQGTYAENIVINETVVLRGGWKLDFSKRKPKKFVTKIISPNGSPLAVVAIQGNINDPASVAPTIDGFTLTGARSDNHGGGVRMQDSNATLSNNVITDNVAYLLGGGIWVQRGAPLLKKNRIENNFNDPQGQAGDGGGVELESTTATLMQNIIAHNVISASAGYGGGVAILGGAVTLDGNLIANNAAAVMTSTIPSADVGYGGGVYAENAPVNLINNLIQENAANGVVASSFGGAYGYGGGVYIANTNAFKLTGNTIISNTASYKYYQYPSGGGLQIESSAGTLSDNVISANHANGNVLFGNGGGLAVYTSTLQISGGQIRNNTTSINCEGYGGGLYAFNSSLTLNTARIENNCAGNTPSYGLGGGLAFVKSPYTLTNTIVDNNYAFPNDTAVGGLSADADSPGMIVNNTFASNKGQALRVGADTLVINNILLGATTGISLTGATLPTVIVTANDFYNNGTNARGVALDVSNIVVNPQLDANQHLTANSSAMDAGTRANAPTTDFDGEPRPMQGASGLFKFDIGADEFKGAAQTNFQICDRCADFTLIGPGNPQDNPNSTGSNDWIGFAAFGGDVNGDGRPDLVAGAPNLSDDFDGGVNDSGRVFALYGNPKRRVGVYDLFTQKPSLEVRSWLHQQHIGRAFASADINGDGKRDLIIGSIGGDDNGKPITGTVYIFSGSGLKGTKTLSPTMQATWRIRAGESTQSFSERNALAAGALNNKTPDDIVIGETGATGPGNRANAGAVRVFFGKAKFPALWDLAAKNANLTIYGPAANAQLGQVALGDVNGDGKLDLLARSQNALYVFFGPLKSGTVDLASQAANVTITGLQAGWLAAGDVVGNTRADAILSSGNQVVVIRGEDLNGTKTLAQAAFAQLTNVNASALAAVNWDGKGKAEIVIGEASKNRALVLFGGNALQGAANAEDRAGWIFYGAKTTDQFGYSLGAFDYDGDGIPDLILGSRSHDVDNHTNHFQDAGAVYVMYGSASVTPK
jgi:hypothetical protein